MSMARLFQFNLKSLFVLMSIVACEMAICASISNGVITDFMAAHGILIWTAVVAYLNCLKDGQPRA